MRLLRRIRGAFEAKGEVLPPELPSMRRIEITVDRLWTVRSVGKDYASETDVGSSEGAGTVARLEKPPDG
jgi:hypothetical protein